jgi:hypothetical protein
MVYVVAEHVSGDVNNLSVHPNLGSGGVCFVALPAACI